MNLAQVIVPTDFFDEAHNHVSNFKPPYVVMHMREVKYVNKKRGLRYLHPIVAVNVGGRPALEGIASGPDILVHYQLIKNKSGNIQVNVITEDGSTKELERFARRFLLEIKNRILQELEGNKDHPRYSKGQFYLKRSKTGMSISHRNCQAALAQQVLDRVLLQKLETWQLVIVHPK